MSLSQGDSFRTKSVLERIAEALPSGGAFLRIRRRIRPLVDRLLSTQSGGFRSVLPGGEVVMVAPAFRHMTWNPEEYAAFRSAVRPGHVVIEAGANVGAYTTLFAQWAGPTGRVFAFEPDPIAFDGLQRHLTLNGVRDRVTAVSAAVAEGREERIRFAFFESSGLSRVASTTEAPETTIEEVRALSIDRFCGEQRIKPDVIKIDVEGAELAALRGARSTIAGAGPQLHLFVEMHPHLWPSLGYSAEDVRRECESQGLVAQRLDGGREDVWLTEGVCLRLHPMRA